MKMCLLNLFKKARKEEKGLKPVAKERPRFNIDWEFIARQEGFKLKGYIPKEENENRNHIESGVTIASGFDLGQHSIRYLDKIGLTGTLLKEKLVPYMELRGELAKVALAFTPLVLTKQEALLVNEKVKHFEATQVANYFDKVSFIRFSSLDKAIQTVIMSVAFQYGDLRRTTPKFWSAAAKGDWELLTYELENFGDSYHSRRIREAKLVRAYLKRKRK